MIPQKSLSKYTTRDFLQLIDSKFEEHLGKITRTDLAWGTWSREMNLELRRRIDSESVENKAVSGFIFVYWITMSQLLDLFYNCKGIKRFLYEKKIKSKIDEAASLKERILRESY